MSNITDDQKERQMTTSTSGDLSRSDPLSIPMVGLYIPPKRPSTTTTQERQRLIKPVPMSQKKSKDIVIPCLPNTFGLKNENKSMHKLEEEDDNEQPTNQSDHGSNNDGGNDSDEEENIFDKSMQGSNHEFSGHTMPIHQIGRAMLIGMGWEEGKPFGRSDKVIEPVDVKLMPKLAGLGSTLLNDPMDDDKTKNKGERSSAKQERQAHTDTMSKDRDIQKQAATSGRGDSRIRPPEEITWVIPGIRVRIISESYHGGKYFNVKGVVEDVPDPYTCIVSIESNGRRVSLENLTESMLETIIPREKNSMVICVAGKYLGKRGVMIDRDRKKQRVSFQVSDSNDPDCGEIVTTNFDDVCEYVISS